MQVCRCAGHSQGPRMLVWSSHDSCCSNGNGSRVANPALGRWLLSDCPSHLLAAQQEFQQVMEPILASVTLQCWWQLATLGKWLKRFHLKEIIMDLTNIRPATQQLNKIKVLLLNLFVIGFVYFISVRRWCLDVEGRREGWLDLELFVDKPSVTNIPRSHTPQIQTEGERKMMLRKRYVEPKPMISS